MGSTAAPRTGIFATFGSPAYSDYEDNTIAGNMRVAGLNSCWLGSIRNQIGGSATFTDNTLADPDANEVLSSQIAGQPPVHGEFAGHAVRRLKWYS